MQYDDKGRLTRAGAEAVIRSGGSVSIGGRTYATLAALPDEAAFAKGDTRAEDAARDRLRQQAADIQRQLAALDQGGGNVGAQQPGPRPADNAVKTITGEHFGPRTPAAQNAGMTGGPVAGTETAEADAKGKRK